MVELDDAKEIGKFIIVGLSGVGVNFVIVSIASFIFHAPDEIAFLLGIAISVTTNYIFNRIWTFKSSNPFLQEYIKYILSNLVGMLIQFLVSVFLENQFEAAGWIGLNFGFIILPSILIALGIAILIGGIANFLFSKYLVFNSKD